MAARAGPTYTVLTEQVRSSPQVSLDETGWRVSAHLHWLWVAVPPETTVSRIQPGRGFAEAADLVGTDYDGIIVRDGWAPYRQFVGADHQTCLSHLIRRLRDLIDAVPAWTAAWPAAILALLQQALALRDRAAAADVSPHGLTVARGRLLAELVRLLEVPRRHPALARFAAHLDTELTALFTFLVVPGTDATNWRAEQAIRPAVEVLASVLQTAHQRGLDPHPMRVDLVCAPTPVPVSTLLLAQSSSR